MSNAKQVEIQGETITYGDCDDPGRRDKKFVSIGTRHDHTTFIVDPDYATIRAIESRGSDKAMWRRIALIETTGYWD